MYAVIFKAEISQLDASYATMAKELRELALNTYHCIEFSSVTEGNQEIAISYWETLEHIKHWKQDPRHLLAQELGASTWYQSYQVQVVEVIREYQSPVSEIHTDEKD